MNPEEMYQDNRAERAYYGSMSRARQGWSRAQRSYGGRWDYVVRAVCLGCGKMLGQVELIKGYAFCFNCRRVLFPETVYPYQRPRVSSSSLPSRNHFMWREDAA